MLAQLPPKTPSEADIVTWDFTDLAVGTITNALLTKATLVGTDPGAATLQVSAAVITGYEISSLVSGGTDNCTYEIVCTITDSSGQTLQSGSSMTTTTDALA